MIIRLWEATNDYAPPLRFRGYLDMQYFEIVLEELRRECPSWMTCLNKLHKVALYT